MNIDEIKNEQLRENAVVRAVFIELAEWQENPFRKIKEECLKHPDEERYDENGDYVEPCAECRWMAVCHQDEIPQYWDVDRYNYNPDGSINHEDR